MFFLSVAILAQSSDGQSATMGSHSLCLGLLLPSSRLERFRCLSDVAEPRSYAFAKDTVSPGDIVYFVQKDSPETTSAAKLAVKYQRVLYKAVFVCNQVGP